MKAIFPACVVAVALLSCAPHRGAVAGNAGIVIPPKAKEVTVEPARQAAAGAEREGAAAQANVVSLTKQAFSLRSDLGKAVAEADRLRKAETRSKEEIEALWAQLTQIQSSHQKVVDDAEAARQALDRQAAFARQLQDEHAKLTADVESAQQAEARVRDAAENLKRQNDATYGALVKADKAAQASKEKADRLAGEILIYRVILAIVIGFFLLKAVLKFYRPLP